jgi:RNA polymerase sigma-70 factor (ECF subfamily)
VPISELQEVLEVTRFGTGGTPSTAERRRLMALRDELASEDRTLLILRVDRNLAWDEIAAAFAKTPGTFNQEDRKRESARLRKRFQLVKRRLIARARARGPLVPAARRAGGPQSRGVTAA